MFDAFKKYLEEKKVVLTGQELEMIKSVSVYKKLRRKQHLLQEGETAKHMAFVCNGFLRLYRISSDGNEHILGFAPENWWLTDGESLNTGQPAKTNIEAIEDSELLLWTKDDLLELLKNIPVFKAFREDLLTKNVNAHQNRIYSNISGTAEEKYQDFITAYPDIYNRVPLHMIASYLGLSNKTLTRVRQQFGRS